MATKKALDRFKVGDHVTIGATISKISRIGAELTIRIPHYPYPVTVPINSVRAAEANLVKVMDPGAERPNTARS